MCRLLAYAAPSPTTVVAELGPEQTRRFERMSLLHDDGWGSAALLDGERAPSVVRDVVPGHTDGRLGEVLTEQPARTRLVHLRLASDLMDITAANTHPFADERFALAHNGSIVPTPALRALLTDAERAGLTGQTDSEMYFTLVRRHLDAGADLPQALAATVRLIRGPYPHASLNAVAMTADTLAVVHSSAHAPVPFDDFVASGLTGDDMPLDHSEAYFRMSYRALDNGGWAFTSAGLQTHDWTPLPQDTIAAVDLATLALTFADLASAWADLGG